LSTCTVRCQRRSQSLSFVIGGQQR
jgi:hypothetical protein